MQVKNGFVFDLEKGFVERDVCTSGAVIAAESADNQVIDASGCYVIPGLVDVHFHGARGEDFSDATPEGLQIMADYELSVGVPYICPAGMTLPEEQLVALCANAKHHADTATEGAELVGVNLEGPFLSEEKKGAQNGAYLRDPDLGLLKKLQETAGGLVKLVTVAPERPGSMEMIRGSKDLGITVSLGHTAADYDTAMEAFQAGAGQCTHLYNGMNSLHHRKPAVLGAAFDNKHVKCELICDGIHIHQAVVRMTWALYGKERMVLISDTLRAAGMPDGEYTLGGQDVIVRGNRATLAEAPDTLAGSATNLMDCMRTAIRFGIPAADAVRAATYNPAEAIGVENRLGTLDEGKDATIILLDKETLEMKAMIFKGKVIA